MVGTNSERSAMVTCTIIILSCFDEGCFAFFSLVFLSLSNLNISSRRNESNESNECHSIDMFERE